MTGKIILLDGGFFCHRAIFSYAMSKQRQINSGADMFVPPSHYTYFMNILSVLKKIGVNAKNDKVILCLEGHSWRKNFMSEYKAQRAGNREKQTLIDWDYHYKKIGEVNEAIDAGTDWHVLRFHEAEADDIMAQATKTFSDQQCIIVTIDKDLFMLAHRPNVRIFSLNKKCHGTKGIYERVDNPLKILASKCNKGDVSDNILPRDSDTEEDFKLREFVIDLFHLPKYIEDPIHEELINLPNKEIHYDKLPFQKSLAKKFDDIYKKDKVISVDYCYALQDKRDAVKKKKAKLKREADKLKKQQEKEKQNV